MKRKKLLGSLGILLFFLAFGAIVWFGLGVDWALFPRYVHGCFMGFVMATVFFQG